MKMSTIVSWFATGDVVLEVSHTSTGKIVLEINDKDDEYSTSDNRVFIPERNEKKLIAAVEAFNKAWGEAQ